MSVEGAKILNRKHVYHNKDHTIHPLIIIFYFFWEIISVLLITVDDTQGVKKFLKLAYIIYRFTDGTASQKRSLPL